MKSKLRRVTYVLVSVLVILGIVLCTAAYVLPRQSFPQVSGQIQVRGLNGPVDVMRDENGIPHIYAANAHDLFFAQGYVHAQDRFWQMDFWRHLSAGRLAEMFGKSQLANDKFLRTMGWMDIAEQEWQSLPADTRTIFQAYADGVNAYLAGHQGTALSLEYAVLSLLNRDYKIEPWLPQQSIAWPKVMAWDLGGNMGQEIENAILLKTFSAAQIAELNPPYPADNPVIVPGFKINSAGQSASTGAALNYAALTGLFESTGQQLSQVQELLGNTGADIGSNDWVIAGSRTASGKPILADDMHLSEQMPAIWYEAHLECTPVGPGCPFDVTGFTFAGMPGVIVGHNQRVAWGFTNVGPDVQDLYIEKINPDNPNQYEYQGQWVDMQTRQETFKVAGGPNVEMTVQVTRHGPIISDVYGALDNFKDQAGIDLPGKFAIAMRWTALEPNNVIQALMGLDLAQNWDDFRKAASYFAVPSQNMVFADVDGNIGYQTPGNIPVRAAGDDGLLPVPGWTGEYEWQGYIPFEQLPHTYNPPQGYVATANNAVVGPDYPYSISRSWAYGFRAREIVSMIENAPGPITVDYVKKIHGDDKNWNAAALTPVLMNVSLSDAHLAQVRQILQGWDYQDQMDSAPAALFNAFWKYLLADTFNDELPNDQPPGGGRWFEVMRNLVEKPDSAWWDNVTTPQKENRDQIFQAAFAEAVADLEKQMGSDPAKWKWGSVHTITFHNQSLGKSGVSLIENIFNRGPFPASGGSEIVNATGWSTTAGSYAVRSLPSERMIVDLSDLQNSQSVITTGQSGHAYHPHYADQIDPWRLIQYHPMYWERSQVESHAPDRLRLVP